MFMMCREESEINFAACGTNMVETKPITSQHLNQTYIQPITPQYQNQPYFQPIPVQHFETEEELNKGLWNSYLISTLGQTFQFKTGSNKNRFHNFYCV